MYMHREIDIGFVLLGGISSTSAHICATGSEKRFDSVKNLLVRVDCVSGPVCTHKAAKAGGDPYNGRLLEVEMRCSRQHHGLVPLGKSLRCLAQSLDLIK